MEMGARKVVNEKANNFFEKFWFGFMSCEPQHAY